MFHRPRAHLSYMRRTSIIDHRIRALQRLDNLVREVSRHADPETAVQIEKVVNAVQLGHVAAHHAHASLVALLHTQRVIRSQHDRTQAA